MIVNDKFKSSSGELLPFKIECDKLTNEDAIEYAKLIGNNYSFRKAISPETKSRFVKGLVKHLNKLSKPNGALDYIIVDDVFTTGASMQSVLKYLKTKHEIYSARGIVIFSRGDYPGWITPIFELNKFFR